MFDLVEAVKPLHSNLVKFKCLRGIHDKRHKSLYIPIWLNSNRFIYQFYITSILTLHSNLVKFKCQLLEHADKYKFLYIPIWLNSNGFFVNRSEEALAFTFQSG